MVFLVCRGDIQFWQAGSKFCRYQQKQEQVEHPRKRRRIQFAACRANDSRRLTTAVLHALENADCGAHEKMQRDVS